MVSLTDAELVARIMQALASPVRVQILAQIQRQETTVGDLVELLHLSQPALSNHMRVLRDLRLVRQRREGRHIHYTLDDDHIGKLLDQMLSHVRH